MNDKHIEKMNDPLFSGIVSTKTFSKTGVVPIFVKLKNLNH